MPRKPKEKSSLIGKVDFRPYEILKLVQGLDRDTLRRWTCMGWIQAKPVKAGSRVFHVYPKEEIPKINDMFELTSVGYAPRKAYEIVERKYSPKQDIVAAKDNSLQEKLNYIKNNRPDLFSYTKEAINIVYRLAVREKENK